MNVVDSSGWLEYFSGGPNAQFFAPALEDLDKLLVPSISVLEVFKHILRERGEKHALRSVAQMRQGEVIDLDVSLAMSAAKLGIDFGLPLADSVILATARARGAIVWTQDADFKGTEGVRYMPKKRTH